TKTRASESWPSDTRKPPSCTPVTRPRSPTSTSAKSGASVTTNRPHGHKLGNTWRDTRGTHLNATHSTHADAWQFDEHVANYAKCIQFKRDLARIHASLERIKENRGVTAATSLSDSTQEKPRT